jgi:tRNA1Val (adenine37-N6)-methyltransferase
MSRNNYFNFKNFSIQQNNAGMRVGTDGVLLGAWFNIQGCKRILDIGTGTGLIALMLAQRVPEAIIHAIDVDEGSIKDAGFNFENSPWGNRLTLINTGVKYYAENSMLQYDSIICNPPFFSNSLKPIDHKRSIARHTHILTFSDLLGSVSGLLVFGGKFGVIIPADSEGAFCSQAEKFRLFPTRITRVKSKPSSGFIRVLIEFRFEAKQTKVDEITIETEQHHVYTKEFIELTKNLYLKI